MAIIGKQGSASAWYAPTQQAVASVVGRPTEAGRLIRIEEVNRSGGGTDQAAYGLYDTNAQGRPGVRVAGTGNIAVASSAATRSANLAYVAAGRGKVTSGGTALAFVYPDRTYALVSAGVTDEIEHGETGRAKGSAKLRWRQGVAGGPPSPWTGTATAEREAVHLIAAEVIPNRAPVTGIAAPAVGALLTDQTPTFTVLFGDADRSAGYEDYPREVRLSIWSLTGPGGAPVTPMGTVTHYPYPAGVGGSSDLAFSVDWTGAALPFGFDYGVLVEVFDEFGARGEAGAIRSGATIVGFSNWFTLAGSGNGTVTAPLGKQTALTPSYSVTYNHPVGYASTVRRARLLRRGADGVYAQEGGTFQVTGSLSAGAAWTFSHATAGFPALAWGASYLLQTQFLDSNGLTSPWEAGQGAFFTNAPPATPSLLVPGSGVFTSIPALTFAMTDADDAPGALTGLIELTGPYGVNGDFEADFAGWTADLQAGVTASAARSTVAPRTGAGAGRITITANTGAIDAGAYLTRAARLPVVEGEAYTFSAYVRPSIVAMRPTLAVNWYTAAGAYLTTNLIEFAGTVVANAYHLVQLAAVVAPATAALVQVYAGARNDSASPGASTVDVDDVAVSTGMHARMAATYVAATGLWRAAPTGDRFGSSGVYSWRARGSDAILDGAWSALALFSFTVGPTIDVTTPAPSSVFATNQPAIAWAVSGGDQNRWKALIYAANGSTVLYDSGWAVGPAVRAFTYPPGTLRHGFSYFLQIQGESAGGALGTSALVPVSINYPTPLAPLNPEIAPEFLPMDEEGSGIRLMWTPVDTPPANLVRMEVWRETTDGTLPLTKVAEYLGYDPGHYVDLFPPSGLEFRYLVRQVQLQGTDVREGFFAEAVGTLLMGEAVLAEIDNPSTERVVLRFWSSRRGTWHQSQGWDAPAGGRVWEEWHGTLDAEEVSLTAQLTDSANYAGTETYTADEVLRRLRRLFSRKRPMLWRDPRGRYLPCLFSGNVEVTDNVRGAARYEVSFTLREIRFEWPVVGS